MTKRTIPPVPSALQRLLDEPKDSATIHYDEDTVPHGACSDPIHCDCMCPTCWALKAEIIREGLASSSASPLADQIDRCNAEDADLPMGGEPDSRR